MLFIIYYIDTSVLLESIPLVKFRKTTFATGVVYFPYFLVAKTIFYSLAALVGKTSCACTVVAKIKKIIIYSNFSLKLLLTVI